MNTFLKYTFFLFLLLGIASCEQEDELPQISDVPAPSNISALFTIADDNSGLVTIQPNGQGVTAYTVFFGDGSEENAEIVPGETAQHIYTEGTYTVAIEAMGINGKITEFTQELTVAFAAPENLQVTVASVPGDPFSIEVSATADLETFFEVYFGEVEDEEPVAFMEGETVGYTYQNTGEYEVRVLARSGGTASIEFIDTVTISNPLLLPIDFESTTLDYAFGNFGGATSEVIENPDVSAGNTSSRVAKLNKMEGSEVWAGSLLELGDPIDFSEFQKIRMKVWVPEAGVTILLKVENLTDNEIFHEVELQNTVASQWEELTFDFAEADFNNSYQKVVVFFDFGNAGTGADYYFDDIELTDGSADISLPLDFEADNIEYEFSGFGDTNAEVIDNPDASGINTSSKVGQSIKDSGSPSWGGVFIELSDPIDFSGMEKVRMKVWAPQSGITVLLKLENKDDSEIFTELQVQNTIANQWEELEFDFTGVDPSIDYQKVVLFFDFENAGTGEAYYFDDITLAD